MYAGEKEGGGARPEGQMRRFREVINKSRLRDIGYIGSDYNWSRRLGSRGWVHERLDRALVSTNWAAMFPSVKLYHLSTSISGHSILVLKEARSPWSQRRQPKLFCFESMWLEDGRCEDVVEEAWERRRNRDSRWPLDACLEECQSLLQSWNKNIFGHVGKQIAVIQNKLQVLESMKGNATDLELIHAIKIELNKWLDIEEEMWHQRS
nr:hypothetical protein CFP56_48643 [Quercus suber]